ncbi:MAG: (2Fe-2S)-binding protein [Halobacteriovoraceae bacterium]|nr:(2Fe-2S)-binding protein [Halobacteriovoraceae bacterium]
MHTVSIEIDNELKQYQVKGEKSLYVELEEQGLKLPHGCLAGACGACKVEILEGISNLSGLSPIEQDTVNAICKEKNYNPNATRLSCRAIVNGSIKLKPLK